MKEVPEDVGMLLYTNKATPVKVYVGLLWGAALRAKELGNMEQSKKYQYQAVGILAKGVYEGDVKRDENEDD